ncbi:nucleotide exchange factor GrpE [Lysinibacillus pakistanensis]|uniref:Protein GrpE n=1 Tax=Lysinibacillus pakistanensis TaxID=759811 RepID=A0AAX3WS77_9BACI|nr:nucleotide exchange factor GrpE [Lysinibacillus pakistanensis]MDM5234497.1 nucleotide exchange factor GrpE [Lysinibacillus pakistanensis]WHY45075.1 nucleotide exchange factor GrpE [Lysinibacillus pakistanensis]WHY50084.1 nucleotide exchange factor GrpE [Lysinibacillus pakistanensis]
MTETTENKDLVQEKVQDDNVQAENVSTENDVIEQQEAELTIEEQYEAKLAELQAKLDDEENRHLRLRADFDNMRRRNQLDREAAEKYRAQSLLSDLLPVLDNFERALQVEATSEEAASIVKGIEMVYRSLIEATEKEGLQVIKAEGEPFDPNIHQAVMQEQDSEKETGVVLRELQKGYILKDRVLRPSMVSVNE